MGLLVALLIIAVLFGVGGVATAAKWLLIFALIFLLAGLLSGTRY
jgi:hypothetical protein